jgi:hypothetical protein
MVAEAATAPQEKPPIFPVFRNREELSDYARKLGFKKIEEFESALDSVKQRERLVEALRKRDPKLNGQVDALIDHLKLNRQEIQRKERWYEKVLKFPGRVLKGAWETVKRHPVLTAVAIVALLYYTGLGAVLAEKIKAWLMQFFPQIKLPNIPPPHIPTIPRPTPSPPTPSLPPLPTTPPGPGHLDPLVPPLPGS